VGEVRDGETAQIAVESALTGHLVLTTLHTNDAPMAGARLIDMGVEPFLVASAVECVLAQRLIRRLCDDCRRPVKLTKAALAENGFDVVRGMGAWEPVGCVRCSGTGYRGADRRLRGAHDVRARARPAAEPRQWQRGARGRPSKRA